MTLWHKKAFETILDQSVTPNQAPGKFYYEKFF